MAYTRRSSAAWDASNTTSVSVTAGDVIAVFMKHEGAALTLTCVDDAAGETNTYIPRTKRTHTIDTNNLHG
jgi:hypothetical protein